MRKRRNRRLRFSRASSCPDCVGIDYIYLYHLCIPPLLQHTFDTRFAGVTWLLEGLATTTSSACLETLHRPLTDHVCSSEWSTSTLCRRPPPAARGARARTRRLLRLRCGSTRGQPSTRNPGRSAGTPQRTRLTRTSTQDDIFSWHFTVRGPKSSDFEGQSRQPRVVATPSLRDEPRARRRCVASCESVTDAILLLDLRWRLPRQTRRELLRHTVPGPPANPS